MTSTPLYILAVPHRGEPSAYICSDRAEFISRMHTAALRSDGVMYMRTTPGELAESLGEMPPELADLPRDASVYRADWLLGSGDYTTKDPGEYEAALAYAEHDLSAFYVAEGAVAARAVIIHLRLLQAPRIGQCGPVRAAAALAAIISSQEG